MSFIPDLTSHGYQIKAELGRNREGGRITWKGIDLSTQKTVVIKQFCFAIAGSSWSGYRAYEREIAVLQKLEHPRIPRYLDCIETKDGFCLVQSYISASALVNYRQLTVSQIQQIALQILDILIYLQQQKPPILHRDLKPDNILLDEAGNTYLIDFGFARMGSHEVSGSSVFKGTPGFIAPEQIIKPTKASDIYSLGVVLVCLLADRDIEEIRTLASEDNPYQLEIDALLPQLERPLRNWLSKMTNAKVSERFADAVSAKQALLELDLPVASKQDIEPSPSSSSEIGSIPQTSLGTLAISGLSTIAVWGIDFAASRLESTVVNVAIAILAAIAVGVAQLGATAIVNWDRQARWEGFALGIIVPLLLVAASGLIWGIQEAVGICAAIAVAEILIVSYYWWQLPAWQKKPLGIGIWSSAIAIGIFLGFKLI